MDDFIDRAALRVKLLKLQMEAQEDGDPATAGAMGLIREFVDREPKAEVVPVVRCKDCKNWRKRNPARLEESYYCAECGWCNSLDNPVLPNDYCSHGTLKDGGEAG